MASQLLSRRTRYVLFKFFALLRLVRWYNIALMVFALYLSAIYLFNPGQAISGTLRDLKLHLEIFALSLFIASGYIINAFYDLEKDMINRPAQTFFDRHISRRFSFQCYFLFNTVAAILSLIVGWKLFLINLLFSVALWLYSHKLRRKRFTGELGAALVTVAPFFSLALYYQEVTWKMFEFVALVFMLILAREIVKKLIAIKGDIIIGDKSIPIMIGEKSASRLVSVFAIVTIMQLGFFIRFLHEGHVDKIFYAMAVLLLIAFILETFNKDHDKVNIIYRLLIVMSILAIPFI